MTLSRQLLVRLRTSAGVLLFVLMAAGLPVFEAAAQLSGIRYTISPSADRLFFDNDAALGDVSVISGRLGFGFGEYLELSALGRYAPRSTTDFSGYDAFGDPETFLFDQLRARDVELLQYGLDLKLNLATGSGIVPYTSIGTGILSLDPDGLDRTETIYLSGSVGVLYRWQDRITFTLEAQRQAWRMNAASLLSDTELTDVALAREDFGTRNTGAYALGAGISFDLGGRVRGQQTELDRALSSQFQRGFSAVRLQVEPFGAWIDFAETLGLSESQRMSGLHAGVDMGSYVGLRGFYWRGVEEEGRLAFDELAAYGGELMLRFGTPNKRVRPHLLVGGGYLNVLDGYEGNGVRTPEDSPFAMVGTGVSIQTGRFFSLHGGARSILASAQSASDVSSPSSVDPSWMYYGGISFELGRGSRSARRSDPQDNTAEGPTEIDVLRAELQRQRELIAALTAGDTPVVTTDSAGRQPFRPSPSRDSREWIALPVPEEGEIYIRFGPPGASPQDAVYYMDPFTGELRPALSATPARPDSARSLTSDEIRALASEAAREVVSPERSDTTAVGAFTRRMEAQIQQLNERLDEMARRSQGQPVEVEYTADVAAEVRPPLRIQALLPFTGYNFTSPRTLLVGGRVELAREGSPFRLLNDVVLGFGSKSTWSAGVNAVTGFNVPFLPEYRLYAGPGIGFLSAGDAQLVLNLLTGVSHAFGGGDIFGEFMTQDLFNNNRFQIGYRISLE